jgi:hypothetical protein
MHPVPWHGNVPHFVKWSPFQHTEHTALFFAVRVALLNGARPQWMQLHHPFLRFDQQLLVSEYGSPEHGILFWSAIGCSCGMGKCGIAAIAGSDEIGQIECSTKSATGSNSTHYHITNTNDI